MPVYEVQSPEGRKVRLEGDSPPTEQELAEIFSRLPAQPEQFQGGNKYAQAAATLVSGAIAEPVAGLVGLGSAVAQGDAQKGVDAIQSVRDLLTYQPQSDEAKALLQRMGEALRPISEAFSGVENLTGELGAEIASPLGESAKPFGAAIGAAVPAAVGLAAGRGGKAAKKPGKAARDPNIPATDAEITDVARSLRGRKPSPEKVAAEANIDPAIIQAAERQNIALPTGAGSRNPAFVETVQALKSRPGSTLAAEEIQAIEALGKRADDLVDSLGGTTDRAVFNESLRSSYTSTIDDLVKRSDTLYERVGQGIPAKTEVLPESAITFVRQTLDDLNGDESLLSKAERQLLRFVDDEGNPRPVTYAALDRIRKNVGDGYKGKGPFKNDARGNLDQVYRALSEDQQNVANRLSLGDDYRLARQLVAKRKGLEEQATALFGRELEGSVVNKLRTATTSLAKGDVAAFKKLVNAVPESERSRFAAQALDQIFTAGSRTGSQLGQGFSTAYLGLKRNPSVLNEIFKYLPDEARKTFDDLGEIATAIYRAKSRENTSRTARDILARIDDPGKLAKLYDTGKTVAAAEGATSAAGFPGAGSVGVIASRLSGAKTAASELADKFLTSPRFRAAIQAVSRGEIEKAERILKPSGDYQAWLKSKPAVADRIARIGFFAWLTEDE